LAINVLLFLEGVWNGIEEMLCKIRALKLSSKLVRTTHFFKELEHVSDPDKPL